MKLFYANIRVMLLILRVPTHYECNPCNLCYSFIHQIALMRNGVLLIEKAPTEIMKELACTNLEEAFLKLSYEQERTRSMEVSLAIPVFTPIFHFQLKTYIRYV